MQTEKQITVLGNDNNTVLQIIRVFAATWWPKPRKAINIVNGTDPLTASFQVLGGTGNGYHIRPTSEGSVYAYEIYTIA